MAAVKKVDNAEGAEGQVAAEPAPAVAVPPGMNPRARYIALTPEQATNYQNQGKLAGFDEVKKMGWVIPVLMLLAFSALWTSPAFARACNHNDEGCIGNMRVSVENDGDLVPTENSAYDLGTSTLNFNDIHAAGDIYTRTSLVVGGRVNATLTLASSSTIITGTNVPYVLIRKNIGGAGPDNTGVGTELGNGLPGAELTIRVDSLTSGSSWIVTPATKTGWTKITFTAALQSANLLYVDDTIGWIVKGTTGTVSGHI